MVRDQLRSETGEIWRPLLRWWFELGDDERYYFEQDDLIIEREKGVLEVIHGYWGEDIKQ